MPTVIIINGFRLYFYSDEGTEPVHIHVSYQDRVAKFWLRPILLASNHGLNSSELKKARKIVEKNENLVWEKWNEFFSRKI